MTRDEAKKLMRQEMYRDLSPEELDTPIRIVGQHKLTPLEMMGEVDNETDTGLKLLNEFIKYKEEEEEKDMNQEIDIDKVLTLMQVDLDAAPSGWADEIITEDDDGTTYTPNQVFQQVKDRTEFGLAYAKRWLVRHQMLNQLQTNMPSFGGKRSPSGMLN